MLTVYLNTEEKETYETREKAMGMAVYHLEKLYNNSYKELLEECEDKDYGENFLNNVEPEDDKENALRENGYLRGLEEAKNQIEREQKNR